MRENRVISEEAETSHMIPEFLTKKFGLSPPGIILGWHVAYMDKWSCFDRYYPVFSDGGSEWLTSLNNCNSTTSRSPSPSPVEEPRG
jgi:hypothetical protein